MHIFIYSSRISLVAKVSVVRNRAVALRFMFWVLTFCEKRAASCSPFLLSDSQLCGGGYL